MRHYVHGRRFGRNNHREVTSGLPACCTSGVTRSITTGLLARSGLSVLFELLVLSDIALNSSRRCLIRDTSFSTYCAFSLVGLSIMCEGACDAITLSIYSMGEMEPPAGLSLS